MAKKAIQILTVDNFIGRAENKNYKSLKELKTEHIDYNCYIYKNKNTSLNLNITLKDFKDKNIQILDFFKSEDDEDDFIISINDNEIKTGNYVGYFVWNGVEIEIKSRFSEKLLKRMLNFANDIYIDDVDVAGETVKNFDITKFIIYYLFLQKFERAFLLGIPKEYKKIDYHHINVKGNINMNRYIKNDIPFKGKISSTKREQIEIQEIIDILYKAVKIIKKDNFSTKNISHIIPHLKENKSNNFISKQTFKKVLNSKALKNPIFAPYKQVLNYAKMIIDYESFNHKDAKNKTFGFLINISKLFELYIVKLLRLHFDWDVIHEEKIKLYENSFFARHIYPDIVMKKDDKVMVFDVKYKKMNYQGSSNFGMGDVDRCDFFQIHTYMSYYSDKIVAGGLLYPLEKEPTNNTNDYFAKNTKFLIDGIVIDDNFLIKEEEFINRIKNLIED